MKHSQKFRVKTDARGHARRGEKPAQIQGKYPDYRQKFLVNWRKPHVRDVGKLHTRERSEARRRRFRLVIQKCTPAQHKVARADKERGDGARKGGADLKFHDTKVRKISLLLPPPPPLLNNLASLPLFRLPP